MNISTYDMFKSKIHFGHHRKYCNPKMKKFILDYFNNISIINLDKSLYLMEYAIDELFKVYKNNGKILFIGTKKILKESIKNLAIKYDQFFINNRWLGGTLTNWDTIKLSIKKLDYLNKIFNDDLINKITKKEYINYKNNIDNLRKNLDGIKNMIKLPDALFVIDINKEKNAINEANKLNIPIFAIVDTNSDPTNINFVIPGNDDSIKSIDFYLSIIDNKFENK
ncbi:30S ribosomal protein S2 [endosymbiont of Sipalinus gigas]|uniref:30S ribosomal protein S2 n=1 Tax=endosymbiont of Sipalinus gigas TaxID=1972134 RepID=UPI000DC713C9|nr:30S ribosomal protein S2 [endosymbiont of Sipalinus gigas]BBA85294.1 30S ribosomal protein S2 [endosymbiont of Sipalinus gigas]